MFDRDHFVNKKKMVYAGIFNNLFILENFFDAKITSSLINGNSFRKFKTFHFQ